ncbi:c-myc promoter binding protein [Anaeramoeba flamelloides]|uniref:C-myc promoter binding protein n=1 Tax=Anaeramoeba flamelloides TaxID=1746091 RepID=A0ABQ8Z5K8_9EUKA|nr:c-myc promoter binding protein [Anaeramoeba flamelloides]
MPNDFKILFSCLSLENIILIWGAILKERKLLFISRSLEYLTPCIYGFLTLIYPFKWSYPLIPILPLSFNEVFQSPVPYIIGCLSSILEIAFPDGDEIIIDLDSNYIVSNEPITSLPPRIYKTLLDKLKKKSNLFKKPRKSLRISPLSGCDPIKIKKYEYVNYNTSFSSSDEETFIIINNENKKKTNTSNSIEHASNNNNKIGDNNKENNNTRQIKESNKKNTTNNSNNEINEQDKDTDNKKKKKRRMFGHVKSKSLKNDNKNQLKISTNDPNISKNKSPNSTNRKNYSQSIALPSNIYNKTKNENNNKSNNNNENNNKTTKVMDIQRSQNSKNTRNPQINNNLKDKTENENKKIKGNEKEKEKGKGTEKEKQKQKGTETGKVKEEGDEIIFDIKQIRKIFLLILIKLFKKFTRYLIVPKNEDEMNIFTLFDDNKFLQEAPEDCVPLLKPFLKSQMFNNLIEEKIFKKDKEYEYFFKKIKSRMEKRGNSIIKYRNANFSNWGKLRFTEKSKKMKKNYFLFQDNVFYYSNKEIKSNNISKKIKMIPLTKGRSRIEIPKLKHKNNAEDDDCDISSENENSKTDKSSKNKNKKKTKNRKKNKQPYETKTFNMYTFFQHKKNPEIRVEQKLEFGVQNSKIRRKMIQIIKANCVGEDEMKFLNQFVTIQKITKKRGWGNVTPTQPNKTLNLNKIHLDAKEKQVHIGNIDCKIGFSTEASSGDYNSEESGYENNKNKSEKK